MMIRPARPHPRLSLLAASLLTALVVVFGACPNRAEAADGSDAATRHFDVPLGDASVTVKEFAKQAERPIMYPSEPLNGVQTNPVKGDFEPKDALQRMLSGTDFVVIEDATTGALAIKPINDPNAEGAIPTVVAPTHSEKSEEAVQMNPYEVQADSDRSYGALNSNSITQFNTELSKLPIAADIFDEAFMKDIGADSVEQMIETYSAGAGFSDSGGGANASAGNQPGDRVTQANLQIRGLNTPAIQRDGFIPVGSFGNPGSTGTGYTSSFDTERVEVIMGPQSLLYGGSGDGGVVNLVSKQARLGAPPAGSVLFRVDQYGNKTGQFDYGVGTDTVAVRLAVLTETVGGRRINVGGNLNGDYLQIAVRPFKNTTIRLEGEQTTFDQINSTNNGSGITLTAASTSFDARNGDMLHYLLATNQMNQAAGGAPSGEGSIDNGQVNWNNVDSLQGWWASELRVNDLEAIDVDTTWNSWLSTKLQAAYNSYYDDWVHPGISFNAPDSNPLGVWAMSMKMPTEGVNPGRTTVVRASALMKNDLFGGKAHSQTSIGVDFSRHQEGEIYYGYYQADSNFNVIVNPSVTSNEGRTEMTTLYWPIASGLDKYPLFAPRSTRITLGGVNYVRMISNLVSPAYISAANPLGVSTGGGSNQSYKKDSTEDKGLFGVNYTQWMDGKLDTLAGFRLAQSGAEDVAQGANNATVPGNEPDAITDLNSGTLSFDLGADYAIRPWLHPYFSFADSYDFPADKADPYGNSTGVSHAYNEEVGVKVQNEDGTLSGSLAAYHVAASNAATKTPLESDINPSGLNGTFSTPDSTVPTKEVSEGVQVVLTGAPTPNWRIRLSASTVNGTIGSNSSYAQLYNDQFHENSTGQVTYADGTVVYVPASYNSKAKTLAYTQATAPAGSIPLTVLAMSTPGNAYYASPQVVTGQITAKSAAGEVLGVVDPVHGPILTGNVGLPISAIQINPALSGVTIPGTIQTTNAGNATTGYPEFSMNLTSVYTFSSGWLNGFRAGGTAVFGWRFRAYYYYTTTSGPLPGAPENLFSFPTQEQFNLILGYAHKFKRITWSTQLNVTNLFNRYQVIILPDSGVGYTTPNNLNATFTAQPRGYVWSNTISF